MEENKRLFEIKPIENDVIATVFSKTKNKTVRLEVKNWLAGDKFVFAMQQLNSDNKQVAFMQCYMDTLEAFGFTSNILDGAFIKMANHKDPNGEEITEVFKSMGGSKKDGNITYRDLTLSKGKKWILKVQECPGKETVTGGFAPSGKATTMISMGIDPSQLKSLAKKMEMEYTAYRQAQMAKLG